MYCCVRVEKIKSLGHLQRADTHNRRTAPVPNADPAKAQDNEVLGPEGPVLRRWREKVGAQKVRSNAVVALQVYLIRSPDWQGDEAEWQNRSQEWLEKEFGTDKILQSLVHKDEKTPHLHALIVPLDAKGKLNARSICGHPSTFQRYQTEYAKAMEPLGLRRGVDKDITEAKHETIKEYYARTKELPVVVKELERLKKEVDVSSVEIKQKLVEGAKVLDRLNKETKDVEQEHFLAKGRLDLLRDLTEFNRTRANAIRGECKQLEQDVADLKNNRLALQALVEEANSKVNAAEGAIKQLSEKICALELNKSQATADLELVTWDIAAKRDLLMTAMNEVAVLQHTITIEADSAQKAKEETTRQREALNQLLADQDKVKKETEALRGIDLVTVAERLGMEMSPKDKAKWRLPDGRWVIFEVGEGRRFHLVEEGRGGRGAIDLVKRALDTDFSHSRAWLLEEFGEVDFRAEMTSPECVDSIIEGTKATPLPPILPEPDPSCWDWVFNWLVKVRRLSAAIVTRLHAVGKVYADKYRNAVFVHEGGLGCERHGTGAEKWKGATGKKSGFILHGTEHILGVSPVVFVESALDAVSATELKPEVAAFSSGGSNFAAIRYFSAKLRAEGNSPLWAVQAEDHGGNALANRCVDELGMIRILPGDGCKDLNERLWKVRENEQEPKNEDPGDIPVL
jgi:hypothetical protein